MQFTQLANFIKLRTIKVEKVELIETLCVQRVKRRAARQEQRVSRTLVVSCARKGKPATIFSMAFGTTLEGDAVQSLLLPVS